jgi:hypothetical protein
MAIYFIIFTLFSFFAIIGKSRTNPSNQFESFDNSLDFVWFAVLIFLTMLIGFRLEVGGDWGSYLNYVLFMGSVNTLSEHFIITQDPAYTVLNWVSAKAGFSIYGVNLVCGLIFSYGLIKLCRSLPRPFLALAIAFPYLVIVVSMGYSRQGAALGLSLLAFQALTREKLFYFTVFIFLAALFHKTAIILLGAAILAVTKNRMRVIFIFSLIGIFLYFLFLKDAIERLFLYYYFESQYQSEGALIRLSMILLPSLLLLIFPGRFKIHPKEMNLWKSFAIVSLLSFLGFFIFDASTAIDRMALYLLPIQLVVFSHLPEFFGNRGEARQWIVLAILFIYLIILFVWLSYANYSIYWQPYRSILFEF